jgi:hypothetical protein
MVSVIKTHTDEKQIVGENDPQEAALFRSLMVHNAVLVYDNGKVIKKELENPPDKRLHRIGQGVKS